MALGNFDGVHRGHQAVIKTAMDHARRRQIPLGVLTLEPHPRSVFKPDHPPFRLTPAPVKERLLRALGVDDVITLAFTPAFSQLPAHEFVDQLLVKEYGVQHVVAGFDFVFGHQRGGNMQTLRQWLGPHNIDVTEVTPFRDAQGEVMSSSRTRTALQQGDLETARHILGRPWSITGEVVKGVQRGQELGFPTANMGLGEYLRPKFGVYAIAARRVGDKTSHTGVANIGLRPTVDGKNETLEFHLFDFFGNLYGQEWEVDLLHFLRPEQSFSNLDALRNQIQKDADSAKNLLSRGAPLS